MDDRLWLVFVQVAETVEDLNAVLLDHAYLGNIVPLNVGVEGAACDHLGNKDYLLFFFVLPSIDEVQDVLVL